MFEREKRVYGLFRQLQQNDLITGDSAHRYSMAVSRSVIDYYQNTGGLVMQALLCDQHWVFTVERGRGRHDSRLSIRAMRGHPVAVLRDIEGPAVKA